MVEPQALQVEFIRKPDGFSGFSVHFQSQETTDIYLHGHTVTVGWKSSKNGNDVHEVMKTLGSYLRKKKIEEIFLKDVPGELADSLYALFEGNYHFERYITKKSHFLRRVYLEHVPDEMRTICKVLDAQYKMKELVSVPYQDRKVGDLIQYAKKLLHQVPAVNMEVHDHKWLKEHQFNLHCAVGKGSITSDPPALLILRYNGAEKDEPPIALVGKGMLYDTGGYSLKPTDGMIEMHGDCAGAILYLHLIYLLAELKVEKNVLVMLPLADNSVSHRAFRLSDIFVGRSGKSVEITNTDAEGRLILSDSVAYLSQKEKVSCVVTAATLTGGVIIALGSKMAGLFSEDRHLSQQLLSAAKKTGEELWRLPFNRDGFMDLLKSDVADMKNAGKREASATQGAVFIYQHHTNEKIPFAHLDIAGPAMKQSVGTAYGLRLFLEFVQQWTNS